MATPCRPWWRNCAIEVDDEIRAIDGMEDRLGDLDPATTGIRELISSLEICHHKAGRWIDNIVDAIGAGETGKGMGIRPEGARHPVEEVWQAICGALSTWCDGEKSPEVLAGSLPASELLALLGDRTDLKEWQVRRVIDKVRSVFPGPDAEHTWLLLDASEYECMYVDRCPAGHRDHEAFWNETAHTIIRDTADGREAALSLALAIDMLWPCHRLFMDNLRIVLAAIGGDLRPAIPFSACGRNVGLLAELPRLRAFARTLRAFGEGGEPADHLDASILARLGDPTPVRRWLAASLDKTLRLQLDPPDALREISALTGPDWIRRWTAEVLG